MTDKNIDFSGFHDTIKIPRLVYLLEGTATEKILQLSGKRPENIRGPYSSLEDAVKDAYSDAKPGETVVFSPASTSFGMFLNEFDRGRKFKSIVAGL